MNSPTSKLTRNGASAAPSAGVAGRDAIARPLLRAVPLSLAALLLPALPVLAQAPGAQVNGPRPPSRVANHYDHKAFQPTVGGVCTGAPTDSVDCTPRGDVAKEVDKIQQDIAETNKKYPPGFLSQPGGH